MEQSVEALEKLLISMLSTWILCDTNSNTDTHIYTHIYVCILACINTSAHARAHTHTHVCELEHTEAGI